MKKIASICFLGMFLFNWFGYRLLTSLLQEEANVALIESLDNNQYSDDDLITIKLPSNLPYYTNSEQFRRVDGEIELNGKHYNFVKCRIYKDSVEYLCIPNNSRTKLSNARDDFYKLVNDLQHPAQSKKSGNNATNVKSPLSEYYQQNCSWSFSTFADAAPMNLSFYNLFFSKPLILPRELPPDAC